MGSEMMLLGHNKQENIKSNFTQTCNRFSQFLKERRSLGHLDAFKGFASSELDIKGKEVYGPRNNATAINLLSKNMEKDKVSLELFPLTNSLANTGVDNSIKDMADCREFPVSKEESKNNTTSPSMTIFYGGKVLVFNELPEDKAQEIMSLATSGTMSSGSQAQAETQTPRGINTGATHHLTQGVLSQGASSLSGFPIARSVSLHRFIEKRKHRIAANAPYQLHNSKEAADSHPQKSDMMKSLYEQQELELKL